MWIAGFAIFEALYYDEIMDKKSKIIISLFFGIAVVSVILTYYKIMIKKDYLISAETGCDPETDKCFARTCDPKIDETCSGDPNERVFYYKIVNKNYGKMLVAQLVPFIGTFF